MPLSFPSSAGPPLRGILIVAVATVAACAGGAPGGPRGRPDAAAPRTAMFISPFGEPFTSEPGQPWPTADWFIGVDRNLDGEVLFDEFTADGRRWFDELDENRSGTLEPAELTAYEARLRRLARGPEAGSRPGRGGRDGRGRGAREGGDPPTPMALAGPAPQNGPPGGARRGGGGEAGGGYGPVAEAGFFNLPQPVKAADVNVDQRVTAEEWAAATERWFVALDTDRDGRLTLNGLPRTPLQARVKAAAR